MRTHGTHLASRAAGTPASGIRDIVHQALRLQEGGRDIIRLEVGESDTGTPAPIIDAALADARAGETRYTASAGQTQLREALAAKLARVNGLQIEPDHIVVTTGAVHGLWLSIAVLCDTDDEIIVPDPGWPNYEMIAVMIGARFRRYRCDPENGFLPVINDIRNAIGPRTRAIVVNSPQNPSGAVYPPEVVREIVAIADARGIVVISDDAYDELYFGAPPLSAGSVVPIETGQWVATYSFSKTYAMTGWRIGYLVAPREIATVAARLMEPTVSCVSAVAQRAALAALCGPQDFVTWQRTELRNRRDQVLAQLQSAGCKAYTPEGAFYVLVDVRPHEDRAFAVSLLEQHGVSVAPGSAFGDVARGFVRICYASGGDRLIEAVGRLLAAI